MMIITFIKFVKFTEIYLTSFYLKFCTSNFGLLKRPPQILRKLYILILAFDNLKGTFSTNNFSLIKNI